MTYDRSKLSLLLLLIACPGPGAVLTDFTGDAPSSEAAADPTASASGSDTSATGTSTGSSSTSGIHGPTETGDDPTDHPGPTAASMDPSGLPGPTETGHDTGDTSTSEVCECRSGCGDGDDDGYPDGCDNCPEVANPIPEQELPWDNQIKAVSDYDQDGLGNACDACPHSAKTGAVPGENCCDPRVDECTKTHAGSTIVWKCSPNADGGQFECSDDTCISAYQQSCFGCDGPCMPPGSLAKLPACPDGNSCDCELFPCLTKWCTVGDDAACNAGNVCLGWYAPGEAPTGLEALGVCAQQGACAGKPGRECATWQ